MTKFGRARRWRSNSSLSSSPSALWVIEVVSQSAAGEITQRPRAAERMTFAREHNAFVIEQFGFAQTLGE